MARMLIVLVVLCTGATLAAHHGYASYDQTRLIWVQGQVEEFRFGQPHALLRVRDGQGQVFDGEWQTAYNLNATHVGASTLKRGDRIIVAGNPQRDARIQKIHVMAVHRITDGWHWPRCASNAGAYDCVSPSRPVAIDADGLIMWNVD